MLGKFDLRLLSISMVLLALLAGPTVLAEKVEWLYEVEVPVASQSKADRLSAASRAFEILLIRLTGLQSLPRTSEVLGAIAEPDLYYNRYNYFRVSKNPQNDTRRTGTAEKTLHLRVNFDKSTVSRFVDDQRLPVWSSNRPSIIVWLVQSGPDGREVIDSASQHPLVAVLKERALARGLNLLFPIMDLDDQLRVTPSVIWGRLSQVLDPAGERYGAEHSIIGRVREGSDGEMTGDWRYRLNNQEVDLSLRGMEQNPGLVIDQFANDLAAKYAVLGVDWHYYTTQIVGVDTVVAYGQLMGYLKSLEYLGGLRVLEVRSNSLLVALRTRSSDQRLLQLLKVDNRLLPVENSLTGSLIGMDNLLQWQVPE